MLALYIAASAIVTFIALMKVPSKMGPIDNTGGSIVVSICFGWAIWPMAIWAARKAVRNERE